MMDFPFPIGSSGVFIEKSKPEYTGEVTGVGTIKLLEAMRAACLRAPFYQASSSCTKGSGPLSTFPAWLSP
jgi:GDPmannose 4,6-dehydratase